MRKIKFLSLFIAVCVVMATMPAAVFAESASAEPAYVWDFYYEDVMDSYNLSGFTGCDVSWKDHQMVIISDEDLMTGDDDIGDINFTIEDAAKCGLDCDANPYIAIKLCNKGTATQYEGHFGTSLHSLDGAGVFHFDIEASMTESKVFVCYIPDSNIYWTNTINGPGGIVEEVKGTPSVEDVLGEGESHWEGTLKSFRIDGPYYGGVSGEVPGNVEMDIDWIAFFPTEAAAKAYAGPDHSEPTPEPEATPAPEISGDIIPAGTVIFNEDMH